jgi:hypothetical protein
MDFIRKRIQHLTEKWDSSMAQFWTSVDDVVGSSLTVNPNPSSLECYGLDGENVKCETSEKHCSLLKTVFVGDIINTLPNINIPAKAGCTQNGNNNFINIDIITFK